MLTDQALNTTVAPLTADDTIVQALEKMKELEVGCLPVIDRTTNKLIGQLKIASLREVEDQNSSISTLELEEAAKIYKRQHIFEAARLMLQYEMRLLPVVDDEMTFSGIIQKQTVLETITDMLNLALYGSILTVELDPNDFTLSEIVHLIEVEGAKILGITVETPSVESDTFKVSVKINLEDASRVASALRRYDYNVIIDDLSSEVFGLDMETRAGELLKYMDM